MRGMMIRRNVRETLRLAKVVELDRNNAGGPLRSRRLARYDGELVLLDPKDYGEDDGDELGDKVYERVKDLAEVLHGSESDGFLGLKCNGWYEDTGKEQFYFVFRLPTPHHEENLPDSLLNYLSSTFRPSLTARIRLAHALADAIGNIHRKGWMHKGIRSENVVFISSRMRSLDDPRLIGFDFARREGEQEHSEKPLSARANLYRHPSALRDPKISFSKRHDYYAFGLLLVEIGLWRPLQEILKNHSVLTGEEFQERDVRKLKDILLYEDTMVSYLREIAFHMGEIYRDVVEACLVGDFGISARADDQLIAAFNNNVVMQLGGCKI